MKCRRRRAAASQGHARVGAALMRGIVFTSRRRPLRRARPPSESTVPRLLPRMRIGVEYFNQVINRTFKCSGEPQNHSEARHFHAAFEIADEWVTRTAAFGELSLSQPPREAKFAQTLAEDYAFSRDRQNAWLLLTNE
jgi:hypothetical protein